MPVRHRRERLDESLISLFSEIGQPISIDGTGIDADDYVACIDGMADMAMESTGITTNPRDADSAQLKEFFRQALEGKA
jgi:alcohol dehydrogenase